MLKLAARMLRHRAGSAVATLVALAAGVMILMTMGVLVESGLRFQPTPSTYARSTVVVAHRDITVTQKDFTGDVTRSTVDLPEGGTVPAELAERIRRVPGVESVTTDDTGAPAGRVDTIGVRTGSRQAIADVERLAREAGVRAYTGADRGLLEQPEALATRSLLIQIGGTFGGYVVLLIVFVVAGTVGLSVRHRRRDLALLRAVAATPGQVRRMIVGEAMLLGLAAAVLGLPAGRLATGWVHDQLVARGFLDAGFPMVSGVFSALAAVAVIVLAAVCSALIAARRATAIRPVEALGEADVEPPRTGRVRPALGLLALTGAVSAGGFAGVGGGEAALASAIGMLYLFVIAVALLAPWINGYAARLLTPLLSRGRSGYLAAANLRANARGMSAVLTALVLSVGFGGSVWFLQDNLERAVLSQQREGVLADRALISAQGLPAEVAQQAAAVPGVRGVTGVHRTAVLVTSLDGAETVEAQAIDPRSAATTMDPGVRAGSLADLDRDNIAVSTLRAGSQGWKLGDRVELWLGDGTPVTVRVAALYQRGLGFGDVTLSRATVAGHTRSDLDEQVLVRTDGSAAAGAGLAEVAARHPGASLVGADDLSGRLAEDLAISAWLNKLLIGVMVGYAALAAANTMVMAALARRRELSLLRLAGVTRRQIRTMVNAEQGGLLGVALVIGGAVAALTLTMVVHGLTGDALPYVPPLGGVIVVGGTALLALFATVLPVGRLLRAAPLDHLGGNE